MTKIAGLLVSATFVGLKMVSAYPMNRKTYNDLRNWEVPEDENPLDDGFLVEYHDGGPSNHAEFKGYISWSPKEVFENSYKASGNLSFSEALKLVKEGFKVARSGWNGKGMFIFLVNGSTFKVNRAPLLGIYPEGTEINYHAHIDMKTADDKIVPWLASQSDVLADDWCIVS